MMDFTPRLKQICKLCWFQQSAVSVKNLAESVSTSKRTVQRELEYIQGSLKGYDITFYVQDWYWCMAGKQSGRENGCFLN